MCAQRSEKASTWHDRTDMWWDSCVSTVAHAVRGLWHTVKTRRPAAPWRVVFDFRNSYGNTPKRTIESSRDIKEIA